LGVDSVHSHALIRNRYGRDQYYLLPLLGSDHRSVPLVENKLGKIMPRRKKKYTPENAPLPKLPTGTRPCDYEDLTYNFDTMSWECTNCGGDTHSLEQFEDHIELWQKLMAEEKEVSNV
jgi:hypothetical protein